MFIRRSNMQVDFLTQTANKCFWNICRHSDVTQHINWVSRKQSWGSGVC